MTDTLQRKLERIARYRTRYELVAEHKDGRRYLVIYTDRRSRAGLYSALVARLNDGSLDRVLGSRVVDYAKRATDGATIGDWRIYFSGRTQRDCYLGGELPFLSDVA